MMPNPHSVTAAILLVWVSHDKRGNHGSKTGDGTEDDACDTDGFHRFAIRWDGVK